MEGQPVRSVKDVPAETFIKSYAEHLKASGKIKLPEWVDIVKTASFKELPPRSEDWYYVRAAAVARKLYYRQNLGVGLLRKKFGGRQRRGAQKEHKAKGAGGLIRHIFQQLENMQLVENTDEDDIKGGRRLTPAGQRDMDLIAGRIEVDYTL